MEAFAVSKIAATVPSGTRILAIIPMKFELYYHLFLFETAAVNLSYPILSYMCTMLVGLPRIRPSLRVSPRYLIHCNWSTLRDPPLIDLCETGAFKV